MLFTRTTPSSPTWTLDFEPAFSPRFSFPLSPRSFFHTRQRFPNSNHVTSGCMSPRSTFDQWSAVSHTGNDMTSSSGHVIALDQSGAFIFSQRAHSTTNLALNSCSQIWAKFKDTLKSNGTKHMVHLTSCRTI